MTLIYKSSGKTRVTRFGDFRSLLEAAWKRYRIVRFTNEVRREVQELATIILGE
jgi:hypothetical protein